MRMDNETRFEIHLRGLLAYAEREGHCRVPSSHAEPVDGRYLKLGAFVGYVRSRYRSGLLAPDRISALEGLAGWDWGPVRPGPIPNVRRNRAIVDAYRSGASLGTLAERYDLSRQRIHQIVSRDA